MENLTRRASLRVTSEGIAVTMASGNTMLIPVPEEDESAYNSSEMSRGTGINITEQINSSGVWTSLEGNTSNKKQKKSSER